jgi:hypothetical protein
MTATRPPLAASGDLHGHLDLFQRLLERSDREVPDARIVALANDEMTRLMVETDQGKPDRNLCSNLLRRSIMTKP